MAELLQVDYEMHKMSRDPLNLALRRYAGMTLTNLTFGDVANKVLRGRRGRGGAHLTPAWMWPWLGGGESLLAYRGAEAGKSFSWAHTYTGKDNCLQT